MPRTDFPDHVRHAPYEQSSRSTDILQLREQDRALTTELLEKQPSDQAYSEPTDLLLYNAEFAELIKNNYTPDELHDLEQQLNEEGTLTVTTVDGYSVEIDGIMQPISCVAATELNEDTPNHGEMASMLYLRDHIQTASVLMELSLNDPAAYQQEARQGKTLLMSALHLMSTPAQLERFAAIISSGTASQEDWPHISLLFDDLEGNNPNGWRNKQDTFQMLAYLACDAIERGFIAPEELSESHKTFLGSVAPLLKAVGFPRYESSGSWEEIEAERTSVMAVETALLDKITTLTTANESLAFLRGNLDAKTVVDMRRDGLREIGRRLPFESPDYPKDSIKYREADAALTYVLLYNIPELLASEHVPTGPRGEAMTEQAIEQLVLAELATLIDPETGGMCRYNGDSYQRVNFHTNEGQEIVGEIKHEVKSQATDGQINLDKKQSLRGERMPQGREAAWTHPLGQLSAWAAKRSISKQKAGLLAEAAGYRELSTSFLNQTIATITGNNQWHAVLDTAGKYIIKKAPANRLPECYITYETHDGTTFVVPSPHTPLNWSSAMLKEAVGLLRVSTVLQ